MFDYTVAHWASFLAAAFLLNIAPGPDLAFILGHTVKGGRTSGFAAMTGVWTGAFAHVILAALGLSAIIAASSTAFGIVKWLGVAYLFWIGIQCLRSEGGAFTAAEAHGPSAFWPVFRQGVLVDLFNPKVATFFLAFLPQFVVENAGPVWAQLLLHGTLIIVVAALVEPPLVLLGDRMSTKMRTNNKIGLWLDRSLGGLLIALGLRLATLER